MNKPRAGLLVLLSALALCTVPLPGSAEIVPARIRLKNKQTWDVRILYRRGSEWIRIKRGEDQGDINFPVSDIQGIVFDLEFAKSEIDELVDQGKFKEAAARMEKSLIPIYPYLDIPNNVLPYMLRLAQCRYSAGEYDAVIDVCDTLLSKTEQEPFYSRARLFKSIVLVEQDEPEEANAIIDKMEPPPRSDDAAVMYWYTLSKLQMARGEWAKAQESSARIVAFHPKNREWMPAGLYLSARGYARTNSFEVAEQMVEDLQFVFPESSWSRMGDVLKDEINEKRKAQEEAALELKEEEQ